MARQWSSTIEPVAHLHAVAVDRQRLVLQRVGDHERDQLFGELVRAVVVGSARDQHRQPVGNEVRARQQVAAGLGRRIGAAGVQRIVLGGLARRFDAAVDFVGRDVHETRGAAHPGGFEQRERAAEVGLEHRRGREDAAVHVRFGGEVHDGVRPFFGQQRVHQRRVADVALNEAVARVRGHGRQVLQVARVGQLIEHHHARRRRHPAPCGQTRTR